MSKGVDISSYQGRVDFDALRSEVSFVISKASEGTGFIDPTFARNWSETGRVGLRRGAYHFARPDLGTNASDEADFFVARLGSLSPDDILALDYEVDWDGDVVTWCGDFLDRVLAVTKVRPYIYLNLHLASTYDWGRIEQPGGYPLWLADYDELPDTPIQTMWPSLAIKQYSSSGWVNGVVGMVDVNTMFEEEDGMDAAQVAAAIQKALEDSGLIGFMVEAKKRLAIDAHHTHTTSEPVEPK